MVVEQEPWGRQAPPLRDQPLVALSVSGSGEQARASLLIPSPFLWGQSDPQENVAGIRFIYKGRSYSSCTTAGRRDKKLWCATTSSYDRDGRWRFCSLTGPDSLPCTFPFKYKGKSSSACTRDGSADKRLWCATTSDYHKDGKWEFCTRKGKLDFMM
ncbi:matrix metalloproteinase-9-like [Terrapene carolina triunguis]|uniref:matrix metalloproteinase-9-like n=1 Tax=Terrapene triunguis TaxID=2587831 RepID=UPI001156974B|nr:matrix metalloproteinase-9-like [Terrapene carolina triunguis]